MSPRPLSQRKPALLRGVLGKDHRSSDSKRSAVPSPRKEFTAILRVSFSLKRMRGLRRCGRAPAIKGRHGGLNICPDYSFHLNDDNAIVTAFESGRRSAVEATLKADGPKDFPISVPGVPDLRLLDTGALDTVAVSAGLAGCPRNGLTFGRQHAAVRQEEQNLLELALRRSRCAWVADDWGSGRDGFLATALHRFRQGEQPVEAFDLQCDEAPDVDGVESLFIRQFGMPLQRFCTLAAALTNAFLIFDEVYPELCAGEQLHRFERVVRAIMDYCPNLSVIVTSRMAPNTSSFPLVSLHSA